MTRYFLKVKQGSDKYLSPWKISNIIEDLASEYYKKNLLDQLTDRLSKLQDNQIPIVFNSSFDLYQKYSKLIDFKIFEKEDIENLYYLGNIIPMKPNIKIKKMDLIFKLHRKVYKILKANDILMDRSKIIEYVQPNFNDTYILELAVFTEYTNSLIDEENSSLKNKIEKIVESINKELKQFEEFIVNFKLIESYDENEFDEYIKDSKKLNFYNKHYGGFFNTFKSYKRPIIAIIDISKGEIEFLAVDFIKESLQEMNEEKIEVKELSKNSPTIITWVVGYIATSFIANVFINSLDNKKVALEEDLPSDEVPLNPEIIRLNAAIAQLRETSVQDEFSEKVIQLDDYKAKRGLEGVNKNIKRKIEDTFSKNDFLNSNIEIREIEEEDEDE